MQLNVLTAITSLLGKVLLLFLSSDTNLNTRVIQVVNILIIGIFLFISGTYMDICKLHIYFLD